MQATWTDRLDDRKRDLVRRALAGDPVARLWVSPWKVMEHADPWQRDALTQIVTRGDDVMMLCSRGAGKTKTFSGAAYIEGCVGGFAMLLSRSERQALRIIRYVKEYATRLDLVPVVKDNMHEVVFDNGGRILALPCSGDTIVGEHGVTLLGMDEAARCFVSGTLVDVPKGRRAIESLKVGDPILSAAGVDSVKRVTSRAVSALVRVIVGKNEFVSSVDHLYLTRRGWVPAVNLRSGDELVKRSEAMSLLRDGVSPKETERRLLRDVLREDGSVIGSHLAGDRTSSQDSRWERSSVARTSAIAVGGAGERLGAGVRGQDELEESAVVLLRRHRQSDAQDSGRGRRSFSCQQRIQETRCEEGRAIAEARVDRVEVLESTDPRFLDISGGRSTVKVHDVGVTNHPSFSVGGFLVHNCRDEFYAVVTPMLAVSKEVTGIDPRLALLSTPFGQRGFFWEEWEGNGSQTWKRHRYPWTTCPRISADFIEKERARHGTFWIEQEYECKFLSTAQGFFDVERFESCFVDADEPTVVEQEGVEFFPEGTMEIDW